MSDCESPPEHIQQIIDDVNERDRVYFTDHPRTRSYVRPYVHGEFWPCFPDAPAVLVTRLHDARLRTRQPAQPLFGFN